MRRHIREYENAYATKRRKKRILKFSGLCLASFLALYLTILSTSKPIFSSREFRPDISVRTHIYRPSKREHPIQKGNADHDELRSYTAGLDGQKFILFSSVLAGQGAGNIVTGLLAAHLLGSEFDRTVCLLPDYADFLYFFESVRDATTHLCKIALKHAPAKTKRNHIQLVNFGRPTDECELKKALASKVQFFYMTGNTYPRWPSVPVNYFFEQYKPKPRLLASTPRTFTTVVHLREPDHTESDFRPGLEEQSLSALCNKLPKGPDTYLVSNNVTYYKIFSQRCQWSHPPWTTVAHSATGQVWNSAGYETGMSDELKLRQLGLHLWSDWYSILTASSVYHTHSDFSSSAVHWVNNIDSHRILGYNESDGTLSTQTESWLDEGESVPLSLRTRNGLGSSQLKSCGVFHYMPSAPKVGSNQKRVLV